MTNMSQAVLILGGSGRTGSLVARRLVEHGIRARTASRRGSDVFFDWDDPATYPGALTGRTGSTWSPLCCACGTPVRSPPS